MKRKSSALEKKMLIDEAKASVALDGETQEMKPKEDCHCKDCVEFRRIQNLGYNQGISKAIEILDHKEDFGTDDCLWCNQVIQKLKEAKKG